MITTLIFAATSLFPVGHDITDEIPDVPIPFSENYTTIPNVAQYGEADWSQAVYRAKNITLEKAYEIAEKNPEITYFFRMKGARMVLLNKEGNYRVFNHGDTVFFKGEPWWGSAEGFADGYMRIAK